MPAERIHYLDWLRLGAVVAVVVYHALLPFGSVGPWSIRNAEQSDALAVLSALLPFAFPVFFLLAGASVRFSLRTRTIRDVLAERTTRLLVPLVVGSVALIPLSGYLIAVHNGTWSGSLPGYLATYPATVLDSVNAIGFRPLAVSAVAMHLWFLAWLFVLCLIAAPLFAFLSTTRGREFIDWLARCARWRGATLLFAIPLSLVALPLFGISSPAGWDWAAFGLWGGTFVGGYLLFSDERLLAAARRDLVPGLAVAILGIGGLAATGFTGSIFQGGEHTYDATYLVLVSIHALTAWGVTISVLSAGMRLGFMQRPLPRVAAEAALPTYVLHLPIVITMSIVVVEWPLGLLPKALLNVGFGLATTLIVVATAIRLPIVRPLLGLRSYGPKAASGRRSTALL